MMVMSTSDKTGVDLLKYLGIETKNCHSATILIEKDLPIFVDAVYFTQDGQDKLPVRAFKVEEVVDAETTEESQDT